MTTANVPASYVLTDTGRVLVQLPAANQWGFSLHDDDQEWPGGFGIAQSFALLAADDPRISDTDRDALQWILDDAAAA